MDTFVLMAEAAPEQAPAQDPLGGWGLFLMMGAIFLVFYLILIRPQRKKEAQRQRQREEMLAALAKNDHVMTIGGIHGVVASVSDDAVVLKIDERNDVRMKVTRDAISRVVGDEDEPAAPER